MIAYYYCPVCEYRITDTLLMKTGFACPGCGAAKLSDFLTKHIVSDDRLKEENKRLKVIIAELKHCLEGERIICKAALESARTTFKIMAKMGDNDPELRLLGCKLAAQRWLEEHNAND